MKALWPALPGLLSACLCGALLSAQAPPSARPAVQAPSVTAIGDVHGDLKTLRALLRSVGLIDQEDRWSGKERRLVQTGDLLDRGPDSRLVLELLMRLEKEAEAAEGRVVAVLGNHEVMNLTGDLRYVTAGEFAAFRGEEDSRERARRKEQILRLVQERNPLILSSNYRQLGRFLHEKSFDTFFPPGYFAHRSAFSPSGRYGSWLLRKPVVHREGRALFVHGGLSPAYARLSAEEINRLVKADLEKYFQGVSELERLGVFDSALGFSELLLLMSAERSAGGPHPEAARAFRKIDETLKGITFDSDGPLWYRGLALGIERRLEPLVEQILKTHDVDRIVIGHTVTEGQVIETRFAERVVLIDTGMNQQVYGGRPSALLLSADGKMKVE